MPRLQRLQALCDRIRLNHDALRDRWAWTSRWTRREVLKQREAILFARWGKVEAALRAEEKGAAA